jgi:hypothetical protein
MGWKRWREEGGSKEGSKGRKEWRLTKAGLRVWGGGEGRRTTINPSPALQLQCDWYGVYWTSWNVLLDLGLDLHTD